MLSASEGWASGDLLTASAGTQAVLLHYANGQWETVPVPYSGVIGKLTMVSPTEGWAPIGGGATAGLLHYQDGRWMPYNPGA
jgi:hypothetical protein